MLSHFWDLYLNEGFSSAFHYFLIQKYNINETYVQMAIGLMGIYLVTKRKNLNLKKTAQIKKEK